MSFFFFVIFIGKLFYKGLTARNTLLQGAKKLENYPSKGPNGVKQFHYLKAGTWEQAERDFYAVKPKNVQRGNMVGIITRNVWYCVCSFLQCLPS